MKNFSLSKLKTLVFAPAIFLLILTLLGACKKEETDSSLSYIRVINAAPTLATYYPFLNSTSVSSAALPYGGSTAFGTVSAGVSTVKFTSENNAESLLTKSFTLNPSTYNSFYLINKPGLLDGLLVTDDLSLPAVDKAYVRLINLSPDAPALDLFKTGETTLLISNKTYKTSSGFIAISPGTLTFEAKETTSGITKVSSESTTLVAGYHYDIICGGLINPTNDTERPLNLIVLMVK
ncbi:MULTISPECIES: DUF4397 domain-containing protein [Pedobacter]|uniref:DUF4397 domain-containing protein n=1 Tax=Pedobacter TaxID=84567 RepID=UPI001E4F4F5D|nr:MULTISPECIES: DUF4397 domain-containing protein [Pedobacter]